MCEQLTWFKPQVGKAIKLMTLKSRIEIIQDKVCGSFQMGDD